MWLIIVIRDVEEAHQFTATTGQRIEEKKGFAPKCNSQGHNPVIYFLPLSPTFKFSHHSPTMPSDYDSIMCETHLFTHNPCDQLCISMTGSTLWDQAFKTYPFMQGTSHPNHNRISSFLITHLQLIIEFTVFISWAHWYLGSHRISVLYSYIWSTVSTNQFTLYRFIQKWLLKLMFITGNSPPS